METWISLAENTSTLGAKLMPEHFAELAKKHTDKKKVFWECS